MTLHAADVLEQCLREHEAAEQLPALDEIIDVFEQGLGHQQDIYEQILLPHLGMGERLDVCAHHLVTPDGEWQFRGGEIWLFDGRTDQSWLHAPLLIPFEDIDDTLLLVRRAEVPDGLAARIRPPIVAPVRRALESLRWVVADTGGFEGGRMEHAEFLDELGDHCWYRIDHDPTTGAGRFEIWQGEEPIGGWSANVPHTFEFGRTGSRMPAWATEPWLDPREHPFETAVAADLLDDPYALLRRLLLHDVGVDIDRLGPLLTWKDSPDRLVEFRDDDDSRLGDLAAWMSVELGAAADELGAVVDRWFARICERAPVELPGVGIVHNVRVPGVDLARPRPMVDDAAQQRALLGAQTVYAATSRPAASWLDKALD